MYNTRNGNRERLTLVSHFPGRARVRAEVLRVLPEVADDLAAHLAKEAGVLGVRVSRVTGSMVIDYDPRCLDLVRLLKRIVRLASLRGLASDEEDMQVQSSQGTRLRAALASLNARLQSATRGNIDMRAFVPGTLAAGGLTALLLGRGRRLPEWYDLAFWAFVTFVNLNPQTGSPSGATNDEPSRIR